MQVRGVWSIVVLTLTVFWGCGDAGGSGDDGDDGVDSGSRGREVVDTGRVPDVVAAPDTTPSDTAAVEDVAPVDAPPDVFFPDTTPPQDTSPPSDVPPADTSVPDTGGLDCSEKASLVYVVDKQKRLHAFDPRAGTFTLVGTIDCGESSSTTPGSMGLTLLGTAYINYSDGSVRAVSIEDASCAPTSWRPGTFNRFGMGFVAEGDTETLYIASATNLGRMDTTTWQASVVGPIVSQCELTGNRGELWGYFPLQRPPEIRRLDRGSGAVLESYTLPALPEGLDTFAFTAWGGDFYVFYRVSGLGNTTNVYRFDVASGAFDLVVEDAGMNVVGAGVSICAPSDL